MTEKNENRHKCGFNYQKGNMKKYVYEYEQLMSSNFPAAVLVVEPNRDETFRINPEGFNIEIAT